MPQTPTLDTKTSLILAAVRLIADRGVHGVSLREINAAAGSRNHSAANYYFSDKQGLVAAILEHGAGIIGPATVELLGAVDARLRAGEPVTPRDVLIAGFGSNIALIQDPGFGLHYVRTVSRIVFELTPDFAGAFNVAARPLYEKMLTQLRQIEPERPDPDVRRSLIMTGTALLHAAANVGSGGNTPLGDVSLPDRGRSVEFIFNYFTAAYSEQTPPADPIPEPTLATLGEVLTKSRAIPFSD